MSTNITGIDWTLCCLCQSSKDEALQQPKEQGYSSLERDLNDFVQLNAVPSGIKVSELDDGSGIAATLQSHAAVYHKSCRSACNSYRVKRARGKVATQDECAAGISPKKLRSSYRSTPETLFCIICVGEDQHDLHRALSDNIDQNLKKWAKTTNNWHLYGRLTAGSDAHAMDACYHVQCYWRLRDGARAVERRRSSGEPMPPPFDPMVIAQLVAFVDDSRSEVHKLSDLREMYKIMMSDLGHPCSGREPHATRFKDHLLEHLPEWASYAQGRDVFISHKAKVGAVLEQSYHSSQIDQDEAVLVIHAAMVLRKRILQKQEPFNGSFSPQCLRSPIEETLLSFINVFLQGPKGNIDKHSREQSNSDAELGTRAKIACTLCQLLIFNTVKYASSSDSTQIRHSRDREMPFPLYHGIKLHGDARFKHQIENAHHLGLSVSYDRVMEVKTQVARAVCKRHTEDGIVLPTNTRLSVFTTHDVDNLDSNKTGNLSRGDFHGTCITVTNHLSKENLGIRRPAITLDPSDTSKPKLPDSYVIVPPIELNTRDIFVPRINEGQVWPNHSLVNGAKVKDDAWIAHVGGVLEKGELEKGDVVTWSGFNSQLMDDASIKPKAEIGILPLFPDKAASASMMKHTMEIVKTTTEFINPGQTPVLGGDLPLFAICKQLQWEFPDTLGEDKFVMQLGALHIEDKCQLMMGKVLRGSGWDRALAQADVLSSGRAQSALDDHHIKRTRYAHQVSLVSLSHLKQNAYLQYTSNVLGPCESYEMWCARKSANVHMFKYWSLVIELELLMCRFVRSLREGDFPLYVQVCDELCPWFFVLDHTNYARWLPIHVRDMVGLAESHPQVYAEYLKGNFTVQKSARKFSLIAKDQSHEQMNKVLQGCGGASDLYDNTEALALYMLAGPECVRMIEEFENVQKLTEGPTGHHETAPGLQSRFLNDVKSFTKVVSELGNPFLATNQEFEALDTHDVMENEVVASLSQIQEVGQALHEEYVKTRLDKGTVPISDTIKRNNVYTFSNRPDPRKKSSKVGVQKHNTVLIIQLFLSLQSRPDADMTEFFTYENQREPPSLSDRGSLRAGNKSDILACVNAPTGSANPAKQVTVQLYDMAAIVHIVRPSRASTFAEYVSLHIIPFIKSKMTDTVERVDAMWDTYPEDSLKSLAQQRRGSGARTRLDPDSDGTTPIPKRDWQSYLKNVENKKELFVFISKQLIKIDMGGKLLLSTELETVLSNKAFDISGLQPCNHTEADTWIILHLAHASSQGHKKAFIRTVDSDIVVLAIAFFQQLDLTELWIGFGSGKYYRDIPVHSIQSQLGPSKSLALPLFHALTGCDTTSQFLGCGKKTAWTAWNNTPNLTETMIKLTEDPESFSLVSPEMTHIERFVVLMYSKTCGQASVNAARHHLFSSGSRSLDSIPPTQAALFQHIKRSLLQASFVWKQSTTCHQTLPAFDKWGWEYDKRSNQWLPFWTTLADASKACAFLLHCGCTKACRGNCKCSSAGIRCTTLCKCEGGCLNNDDRDANQ